jgi:hypothetical protein
LSDQGLTLFDVARGGSVTVPLGSVAVAAPGGAAGSSVVGPPMSGVEAVVAGPRVFVTGPGGLLAVNPLTGRVLFSEAWPEPVRRFAGFDRTAEAVSDPGAMAAFQARGVQFTPRYLLHSSATSNIAIRPRPAARGPWLFAVFGADRLVGLAAE